MTRRGILQCAGLAGLAVGVLPAFQAHAAVVRPTGVTLVPEADALQLWYSGPASLTKVMQEGLPIGNGRLGAMVAGAPDETLLILSDASVWSGTRNDVLDSAGQFPYETTKFGTFQMLAKTRVRVTGHTASAVTSYRRSLDMSNGLVVTTYQLGGVTYRQEIFSSHPDDVIVVRLSQSGGGTMSGQVTMEATRGEVVSTDSATVSSRLSGALSNGLRYAAVATAKSVGGSVGTSGSSVVFSNASEVVIAIGGGTDYKPDAATGYRNPGFVPLSLATTKARDAVLATGTALRDTHVADFQAAMAGFTLSLGTSSSTQRRQDTATRLVNRESPAAAPDPELEALYLHLARYLTVTGSRDSLPINLQGLWNDTNTPGWMSDYHVDINLQMNYWPAHRFGLGAHAEAMADYCLAQLPEWQRQTLNLFNDSRNRFRNTSGRIAGWTTAISTNIHGGNGWWWYPAGSAWLCLELWQHYEFTLDQAYLAKIMPLLRGTVQFWESRLLTRTVGSSTVLVADRAWSPEHGPQDGIGNTHDQELVHAVLGYFVQAAATLGTDAALATKAQQMRDQLYLPELHPTTGHLREWMDPNATGEPRHRHLSHLVGFYPGDRINADTQPAAYVDGVRRSLEASGLESYGWALAWRAACWARLKDSTRAYVAVTNQLRPANGVRNGSAPNMFDMYNGHLFQIDANFGVPAAMLEMLVYARPGVIDLVPAVPSAWATGSVSGLHVRGGFRLDMTWSGGRPTSLTLHSVGGRTTVIRVGSWSTTVTLVPGESRTITPQGTPAPPPPGPPYKLVNVHSGLALDVMQGSSSAGAAIGQWSYGGGTNQQWREVPTTSGWFGLQSVRSGLMIDIGGGSTAEGADLIQWSSHGGTNQQWRYVDAGAGRIKILSRHTNKVIGIAGASTTGGAVAEIQTDTGHASQQWTRVLL